MTRKFFEKVLSVGMLKTRKHAYKCVRSLEFVKVIRDDGIVCAVYSAHMA